MRSALLCCLFVACGAPEPQPDAALTPLATGARAPYRTIEVRDFDATQLPGGSLVMFVDAALAQAVAADGEARVAIDGVVVPGTLAAATYEDTQRGLGVGVLIAAHAAYGSPIDPEGNVTTSVMDGALRGFQRLLRELGPNARATATYYNEEVHQLVHPWTNDAAALADKLGDGRVKGALEHPQVAPALYGAIGKALDHFRDDDANLPPRRWLVVLSDGVDRLEPEARAKTIAELAAYAATPGVGVRLYVLGYTLGLVEPLADLGALAVKTGGVYRELPFDAFARLDAELEGVAVALREQPVLTFTPTAYTGSPSPKSVRLQLTLL